MAAVKSRPSIDWGCNSCSCNGEQTTAAMELELSAQDPPLQDTEGEGQSTSQMGLESGEDASLQNIKSEEQATSPTELKSSIEAPSLQGIDSEKQATPPVLVSYQLFEEGTKRGKLKLIDSQGYTYNIKMRRPKATYWQCTVRPKGNPCKAAVTQRNATFVKNHIYLTQSSSINCMAQQRPQKSPHK